MKNKKRRFRTWLCGGLLAVVASASFLSGCRDGTTATVIVTTDQNKTQDAAKEISVLGEGAQAFTFSVVDAEGAESLFEIHTDAATVGEALTENGLLEGEDGPYGLYVKTVNGITADYDKDKVYWAFYINDEYAMSGVDQTEITEGDVYSFRIEK